MSSGVTSHAGRPSAFSARSSWPMSLSMVTGLNPRARQEATNASTQAAWNSHGSLVTGVSGTVPPCSTRSLGITGTPSLHLNY